MCKLSIFLFYIILIFSTCGVKYYIYIALKLFLINGCQIKMIQFVKNLFESVFHHMHDVVLICEKFHLLNTLLLYIFF